MKTTLFFEKPQTSDSVLYDVKLKISLAFLFMVMIAGFVNLKAQTSKIIPDSNVSGSFLSPLANSARTYQMLIDDTQLTPLVGKYLNSISFRLLASASAPWPAADATFSSYQIYLSNGVDPANRQLDFAANITGAQTMVRTGALVIPAGSLTSGGDPNAFSYNILFDSPYLYNGGNLIMEIRHTGSNSTSLSTHAVTSTNTSAGYGTLFSACWQASGSVTNGNFTYIKINSLDALGVKSVTIEDGFSIYPNPVKDNLYVKSTKEITEFNVFNFAGQKVLSQKNNTKIPQLNTSLLQKGAYILQMIDKEGNSTSTKFIKE
ncbi:T9SS type A sorting domain-containing protein [Chryseobacterium formosus]|uniref:T9SS type A sorting domain-containing protein n=1 Tax=Chryseobacterium formosus TaxID=1537363 RepID=A0ABT3XR12_9FLAO|nr:T9SS type A sorting domain-containing protein [Chryseobacterium formosus]MCX8524071.1 T9SS type A sorting domain-containing protein [Chryseobacterium formosus]